MSEKTAIERLWEAVCYDVVRLAEVENKLDGHGEALRVQGMADQVADKSIQDLSRRLAEVERRVEEYEERACVCEPLLSERIAALEARQLRHAEQLNQLQGLAAGERLEEGQP